MQYYDQWKYEVESEHGQLRDGETTSGVLCPACKGGGTQEGSLSVSRSRGVLLFNCHRASCSFRGAIGFSSEGGVESTKSPRVRLGAYLPLSPLSEETATFLAEKFRLTREDLELAGLRWVGEGLGNYSRRVSFPIFGPDSKERGKSYRSYEDGVKPKNIIKFSQGGAVAQSWYKWKRTSKTLVLVEDQVSAIKLAPHTHSIALLGTHISQDKADEILFEERYDNVYLALDNDATYEAIKLQLKWRDHIPNLCVLGLSKDIKNMDDKEFNEFLTRMKADDQREVPSDAEAAGT